MIREIIRMNQKEYYDSKISQSRIALHPRSQMAYAYLTIKEYMSVSQTYNNNWTPEYFISWEDKIGTSVKERIEKILEQKQYPIQKCITRRQYPGPKTVCFDDLRTENNLKYFGKECNVIAEILLSRYDLFIAKAIQTYITTNLSASEVQSNYSNIPRSRLRTMHNLTAFDKTTKNKRN